MYMVCTCISYTCVRIIDSLTITACQELRTRVFFLVEALQNTNSHSPREHPHPHTRPL